MRWPILVCLCIPSVARADIAEEARAFLGDRSGLLVVLDAFENDRPYLFDLGDGSLRPIGDQWRIESPLLSPDGTRIVFTQQARIFIQPLDGGAPALVTHGYAPHWWTDADGDEWIYYDTIGNRGIPEGHGGFIWPDAEGVEAHRVRLRDDADEWLLDWKGDGGPSIDGMHLGAGAESMLLFDLTAGTHALLHGSGYACNPSISPDDRYLLMFLTDMHQSVLVRDWRDDIVWELTLPAGMREWATPEWSNDPDFATAVQVDQTPKGSVYLVNIPTGETLMVLDGTTNLHDWRYPHLWVEGVPAYDWPPAPTTPRDSGGCAAAPPAGTLLTLALLLLRRR